MSTVLDAATKKVTPEELLRFPHGERFELVDGELLETGMSLEASWVTGQFISRLGKFVDDHQLGGIYTSEATYCCYPDAPDKVRRPDVSFIAKGRLPGEQFLEGHCLIVPDLVVEVISPNDLFDDVEQKVEEYRPAGVRPIWVVSPKSRSVTICRLDGSDDHLGEEATLSGEDVLPGFEARIADLFPPKNGANF